MIKLYLESGHNYRQIGDELGVPETTLAGWVDDYKKDRDKLKAVNLLSYGKITPRNSRSIHA